MLLAARPSSSIPHDLPLVRYRVRLTHLFPGAINPFPLSYTLPLLLSVLSAPQSPMAVWAFLPCALRPFFFRFPSAVSSVSHVCTCLVFACSVDCLISAKTCISVPFLSTNRAHLNPDTHAFMLCALALPIHEIPVAAEVRRYASTSMLYRHCRTV